MAFRFSLVHRIPRFLKNVTLQFFSFVDYHITSAVNKMLLGRKTSFSLDYKTWLPVVPLIFPSFERRKGKNEKSWKQDMFIIFYAFTVTYVETILH